jgi:hypothetical protein
MKDYQIDSLLAALSAVAIVAASSWILISLIRRRMAERHEIRLAVLAKLSSEEMVRLLESEGGRTWLRDVLAGANDARAGIERALMLLFAGVGCGAAGVVLRIKPLGVFGLVFFALAAGQIVAAFLARSTSKAGDGR